MWSTWSEGIEMQTQPTGARFGGNRARFGEEQEDNDHSHEPEFGLA